MAARLTTGLASALIASIIWQATDAAGMVVDPTAGHGSAAYTFLSFSPDSEVARMTQQGLLVASVGQCIAASGPASVA